MTWGELKLNCLLEMGDATSLSDADPDTLARMPTMANAGLQRLSTVGKYIKKTLELSQTPFAKFNLLGSGGYDAVLVTTSDVRFSASGARAYYFEADEAFNASVLVNGSTAATVSGTPSGGFEPFCGLIEASERATVELVFAAQYPYTIKNVCLYSLCFASADDIPPFSRDRIFDLKDYAPDIFRADAAGILKSCADGEGFRKADDVDLLPDNRLRVDAQESASYRIPYFAYPQVITANTPDDEVIVCDPDGLVLLTYYICYHLYKGDDIALATQWHNDFEEGLSSGMAEQGAKVIVADGGEWL